MCPRAAGRADGRQTVRRPDEPVRGRPSPAERRPVVGMARRRPGRRGGRRGGAGHGARRGARRAAEPLPGYGTPARGPSGRGVVAHRLRPRVRCRDSGHQRLSAALRVRAAGDAPCGRPVSPSPWPHGVGLVARIAWGRSADRVRNPYPLLAVLASVSALAVGGLMVADTLDAPALVAAAAVFGASGIAANVVIMLALVRTTPLNVVGSASGVLAVGLYLGFALGPVCFGLVADAAYPTGLPGQECSPPMWWRRAWRSPDAVSIVRSVAPRPPGRRPARHERRSGRSGWATRSSAASGVRRRRRSRAG